MSKGRSGKKGIGRSKRKQSSVSYKQAERWTMNKVRRIVKQMKKFENYHPHNLNPQIAMLVTKELAKET